MSIADLDPATPGDLANAGEGAAELRAIKAALDEAFGGVNGPIKKGTGGGAPTAADFTALFDRLTAVETLAAAKGTLVVGMTMFWPYSVDSIPAGWVWANGQTANGHTTRDTRGRYPFGTDNAFTAPGDTFGSAPSAITSSASGSVSAGVTGNTALTAAQLPNISPNLSIQLGDSTTNSSDNHTSASFVARSATGSGAPAQLVTQTGLNGDPHNHTVPAIGTHTHTVTTVFPPSMAGCWITYVGVP